MGNRGGDSPQRWDPSGLGATCWGPSRWDAPNFLVRATFQKRETLVRATFGSMVPVKLGPLTLRRPSLERSRLGHPNF